MTNTDKVIFTFTETIEFEKWVKAHSDCPIVKKTMLNFCVMLRMRAARHIGYVVNVTLRKNENQCALLLQTSLFPKPQSKIQDIREISVFCNGVGMHRPWYRLFKERLYMTPFIDNHKLSFRSV